MRSVVVVDFLPIHADGWAPFNRPCLSECTEYAFILPQIIVWVLRILFLIQGCHFFFFIAWPLPFALCNRVHSTYNTVEPSSMHLQLCSGL